MDLVSNAFSGGFTELGIVLSEVLKDWALYYLRSYRIGLCILCGLTELDLTFSEVLQNWTLHCLRSYRTEHCIL